MNKNYNCIILMVYPAGASRSRSSQENCVTWEIIANEQSTQQVKMDERK